MEAWFRDNADFTEAKFEGDTRFNNVHFDNNLILIGARINSMALNSSQFKNESEILLKQAIFNRLYITWNDIKTHLKYRYDDEYDWATYSALVKNFRDLVRYDDADNCYYEFRKKHQDAKSWLRENRSWISRFDWSKLYDHISWRSCGYGVRLRFTIACISATIFIFTLLFWGINKITFTNLLTTLLNIDVLIVGFVLGHITKFSNLELDLDRLFNHNYSNLLQNWDSFLDNLYLSTMIFIGQTPSDFEPTGFLKIAVIFEGILGYLFLALFVVVLTRKFIR